MSHRRIPTWLILGILALGALIVFVVGLFSYMSLTATPLHSDADGVPSMMRSAPPAQWTAAADRARRLVRAGVKEQNLPGASIAVGVGGEIVWAEAFGFADLETRVPVSPEMRFRIGDVSVPLTSAAVGLLLERNRVALDEEIQTYVPEYPKKQWPVTLRHLMGQVAGVRTDGGDEASLAPCDQTLDGLALFADGALLFEPGTRYRPSTYGWILVSAAVEQAADTPFFTFMRKEVFEPVGMSRTRAYVAADSTPDLVTFYFPRFAGDTRYGPELAREGDHSCYAGASAFLSTASDLARFGIAIDRGTLLRPETVRLLQTPQRLASGEETGYGLGWRIEDVVLAGKPARMAGHGTRADFIGGTTYLMTFPERGIVVAAMSNISFADMRAIALKVADAFAGEPGAAPPR